MVFKKLFLLLNNRSVKTPRLSSISKHNSCTHWRYRTQVICLKTCLVTFLSHLSFHLIYFLLTFSSWMKRTADNTHKPGYGRAKGDTWYRRDEPNHKNIYIYLYSNKSSFLKAFFTAATGTDNKQQKQQQQQKKNKSWIHYREEWVSWLTGTETALSALRQRVAATATTSPYDDGRPTWREREQRTNKAEHTQPHTAFSLFHWKPEP